MGKRGTVPLNGGKAFKGASAQALRLVGGFLPAGTPGVEAPGVAIFFPEHFQGLPGGD